ncbi:aminotransferase class IV [Bacillus timonensis]|nr:aminotransferase class IV [Bacillus timonensis]
MEIGFYDDSFIDINSKVIPIQERGHQFGDGVYEVIRVYNGKPFLMDDHLTRLKSSCDAILLEMPYTKEEIIEIVNEGLKRSNIPNAEVYMQVTRGAASRFHGFPDVSPLFSMTIKNARIVNEEMKRNGITVLTLEDERWANCYIKSLNLLPNVLAKQTAISKGHYEAILVKNNVITEGSSSNIFAIKDGVLHTTPATKAILHGVTRKAVINIAHALNIPVVEKNMSTDFLQSSDEAFITSTSVEILPIAVFDEQPLPKNRPMTQMLQKEFTKLIEQM